MKYVLVSGGMFPPPVQCRSDGLLMRINAGVISGVGKCYSYVRWVLCMPTDVEECRQGNHCQFRRFTAQNARAEGFLDQNRPLYQCRCWHYEPA